MNTTISKQTLDRFIGEHVSGHYELGITWKDGKWEHAERIDIKLTHRKGNAIIASFEAEDQSHYTLTNKCANKRYCGYSMIFKARLTRYLECRNKRLAQFGTLTISPSTETNKRVCELEPGDHFRRLNIDKEEYIFGAAACRWYFYLDYDKRTQRYTVSPAHDPYTFAIGLKGDEIVTVLPRLKLSHGETL